MIALGSKRNVQPNEGTNDGIMEFTVLKSIASPLFPFTAPFNLPSASRGVAIGASRVITTSTVQSVLVLLLLGDRKRGGVFVRESGRRSVQLTAEEDGGGPAPEVP